MSSIPEWQQLQEAQYFNWKCLVCNVLAKSPCHLEEQFLVEHGVYVEIDGTQWVNAINASLLTTLPAPKILLPMVNITVPFLSVNIPKILSIFSLSSYDFFSFVFWFKDGKQQGQRQTRLEEEEATKHQR